ncbi:MAG TPA: amino acid ABC transporter permease [Nocardioidaceae bacterium]|nr:amino acid ABC transporter permease [Nocardioidaceae bacterium]
MNVFIENSEQFFTAFGRTIEMMIMAGVLALVLGFVLAALRVSPIPLGRLVGTAYVNVVRNTPLLLIMLIFVFGLPELGVNPSLNLNTLFGTRLPLLSFNAFYIFATTALGIYTAAFVCEAVRSGINSIAVGQAEAARSVGMTFGQTLQLVVMPQAFRAVIPPLASTLIAMTKNSSVAAAVGVTEATFLMKKLINDNADQLLVIFLGFAAGYMVLVFAISGVAHILERKTKVA